MDIKKTYLFEKDNIKGYACGFLPDGKILEERLILVPKTNYKLKNKITGKITSSIWLKNGDVKENYEEIKINE